MEDSLTRGVMVMRKKGGSSGCGGKGIGGFERIIVSAHHDFHHAGSSETLQTSVEVSLTRLRKMLGCVDFDFGVLVLTATWNLFGV